ncbi:uncharacterized protein EI90DRAFT_3281243 [Cantharellus anzutake]|uniref:uncharacterized protein n=1 Tax=Cantharellus anzutake TaxID=1750568 RepID=UPI0019031DDC|nr:uncharacterized protein EI90DRAFT_3281243 [Cantharellus anzutake]KAF8328825.1 hypothetical protein EI90DRAFT_3281243 [Cantharellus anzutake]
MPPKGANSKKEQGNARKAENEEKKKAAAAAEKEKKEAEDWSKGTKRANKSREEKDAKKAADAARKAENARLIAEEEASIPTKKPTPKATKGAGSTGKKSATPSRPAGPGAIAVGGGIGSVSDSLEASSEKGESKEKDDSGEGEAIESYTATGLDEALEMMTLVTAKTDKASLGQQAAKLEAHPERRFKAAFETYLKRELPEIKQEHPGLRSTQYRELLFKKFQKAPENPFNQTLVAYNATNEDKVSALNDERERAEERLRSKD